MRAEGEGVIILTHRVRQELEPVLRAVISKNFIKKIIDLAGVK